MLLYRVLTISRPLLAPHRPSHFGSAPNLSELSPVFATLTRTPQNSEKSDPLTPSFSTNRPHSSPVFFTLKTLSPVFATFTKPPRGTPPCGKNWAVHFCQTGRELYRVQALRGAGSTWSLPKDQSMPRDWNGSSFYYPTR